MVWSIGVADQVQHLTTEELSAFLDEQLSSQERTTIEAHLQTCERCQHELASLRQTVALLRALPQPALPRSFVLPAAKVPVSISVAAQKKELAAVGASGSTSTLHQHSNPWPG